MKSCLIVEDSAPLQRVLAIMAGNLGFKVRTALSAEDGLLMLDKEMPDLILLDWGLPKMSGLEFLNVVRRRANGNHPKVVFCTGKNTPIDIDMALAQGADEYIMKPYDKDILSLKLSLVGLSQ